MYEDLLTLGFLASFEMLSEAFSPGLELGLAALPPGGLHTR